MSNKKLSRLLEPNLKFYFAVMLLFAVAAIPVNWQLALAEGTLTVLLYFYFRQSNQKRRQGVLQYIDSVTGSVDTASKSTLINSPLPTLVFRPDTGEIIWSNESFLQLAGVREHLFEMPLSEAVPDFQVQWLLSGKQESPEAGGTEQSPFPGLRQSGALPEPHRRAEPGGHHLLGGDYGG